MSFDMDTLAALCQLSRDAVVAVKGKTVVFANPAAESMLSVSEGDAADLLFPDAFQEELTDSCLSALSREGQTYSVATVRQGAVRLFCLAPLRAVDDTAGASRALYAFGTDLLTMRLAADAILSDKTPEEKRQRYASALYQSYYRMKRLHDHMILAGNLMRGEQPLKLQLVRLGDLCRDLCATVERLVRPFGVTVDFTDTEEDSRVEADASLVETMLLNLLSNSLLHMRDGGTVSVELTVRRGRCIIAIRDNGTGIEPARLASVLNRTARPDLSDASSGAGLGLFIARGIAELHGGALIMESRRGEGTTLRISLPQPRDSVYLRLRQPQLAYRVDGMDAVLTELSVVLDRSLYDERAFD